MEIIKNLLGKFKSFDKKRKRTWAAFIIFIVLYLVLQIGNNQVKQEVSENTTNNISVKEETQNAEKNISKENQEGIIDEEYVAKYFKSIKPSKIIRKFNIGTSNIIVFIILLLLLFYVKKKSEKPADDLQETVEEEE